MKRSAIVVILFALFIVSYASADVGVKWYTLAEGQAKSKTEKKAMIVDFFYGKGCPRCEKLQQEVYDNPVIAKKIMDDFIPIRVDLTKPLTADEERLGEKFDYRKDCLLIFLDFESNLVPDKAGKRLCFIDKVDPEEFVGYLDHVKNIYSKAVGSEKK